MQVLLDGDILLYEVGFICQFKDPDTGEIVAKPLEDVIECIDDKIALIQELTWADEEPIVYLTGKGNFREKVATTKEYKGTRVAAKPLHYNNVKGYLIAKYNAIVVEGMEADDAIGIEMRKREKAGTLDDCICASRDKDLRMINGNHFGWECGKQPQFGPEYVDKLGRLELDDKKKIRGTGLRFFYSQLITGDTVDNIGGLPRCGDVKAFNTLADCTTERDLYEAVRELYQEKLGEDWLPLLKENAYLLWMVRELDDRGRPVMWKPPKEGR